MLAKYSDVFGIRVSSLLRFSESYEGAEKRGAGQEFITTLMSRLIDLYSEDA